MAAEQNLVFESQRRFQLWLSWASHAQVLFQSGPQVNSEESRIEVLFKGVRAIQCRTVFDGFTVRLATEAERRVALAVFHEEPAASHRVYVLESCDEGSGFIVASSVHVAEVYGLTQWDASTLLIGPGGKDPTELLDLGATDAT